MPPARPCQARDPPRQRYKKALSPWGRGFG
jgi:hypothetical protein